MLPLPPSEDRLYRAGPGRQGKGYGLYLSKEARDWYALTGTGDRLGLISALVLQNKREWRWAYEAERLAVTMRFSGADAFDLQNLPTALLNALERGGLVRDDRVFREQHIYEGNSAPGVEVTITEVER